MGGSKLLPGSPVIGLLFGIQSGLNISIIDATDALYDVGPSGAVIMNMPKVVEKVRLWTAVFTNFELLGWYTVGSSEPTVLDLDIHKAFLTLNEAPLFVLLERVPDPMAKRLPLNVYETERHTLGEAQALTFGRLDFSLEAAQVERITNDQITKLVPTDGASTLEVQNQTIATSLRTLESKIALLVKALQAIQEAGGANDAEQHNLVRKAAKICQHLPALDSSTFQESFSHEMMDCMLLSLLGAATKSTSALTELTDLYQNVYGEKYRKTF